MLGRGVLKILASVGLIDSLYLTLEHYKNASISCGISFSDCNSVLNSSFSEIWGTPLAFFGFLHYFLLLISFYLASKKMARYYSLTFSFFGFLFSLFLVYLQIFEIEAICLFCMLSALTSTLLFIFVFNLYRKERKELFIFSLGFIYKSLLKPILFMFDPEKVHVFTVGAGEGLGRSRFVKGLIKSLLREDSNLLRQKIAGVDFRLPVGLAAGFDYEARLTQILPSIGFGFGSVGSITNMPYGGNPKPRLGRLPKSKSLMVNKGFKNLGADETSKRLSKLNFNYPIGVSIGRTNTRKLDSQKESVEDIVRAFEKFESSGVKNSYYELNISCPNLHGDVTFYPIKNLEELLRAVEKLGIKKPIFMKMPIDITNRQAILMLKEISKYKMIKGVIFGNLQKDRKNKDFDKKEVKKFKKGFFSGKPTYERSNELIELAYKNFKNRFVIIGCGGVFSGKDAYEKIKRGASLIQLITGMIYEGPQLISQINLELEQMIKRDGFKNIEEATGSYYD